MRSFDESACLDVNPFEGDFGEPSDRVLQDKIVTTRKPAMCGCCRGVTEVGERTRSIKAIFDGQMMSYRFCSECCHAMARMWDDDGEAWEARILIGMTNQNPAEIGKDGA